jgi:leader peptidase (prepilin peptidase) / N-methyltransferase
MTWLVVSYALSWPEVSDLQAALVCAVACAVLGWFAPRLIARLPEPESPEDAQHPGDTPGEEADKKTEEDAELVTGEGSQHQPEDQEDRKAFARTLSPPPPPPKELYRDIAALPHLGPKLGAWSALIGGLFGLVLGWTGALVYLVPLVPIGVVLLVIDWRTTLLPTRIIHPTYALLAVLIPLAALLDHDLDALSRAGFGWLVIGGWFWIFWWLLDAWGFGDVRLARVLGPALGYLGWEHMLTGLALMVLIGGLGGAVLAVANRSLRRRIPYGPYMLVGAAAAVVAGPWLAAGLGY